MHNPPILKPYSGIGSRDTPLDICQLIEQAARVFANKGFFLRSGHARGADKAFHRGHLQSDLEPFPLSEIYIPERGFNFLKDEDMTNDFIIAEDLEKWEEAKEIAKSVIPWWDNLKGSHVKLHTRNVFQVLGRNLDHPSVKIICWAKPDKTNVVKGGTGTAVRIAMKYGIPVDNLWYPEIRAKMQRVVDNNPVHFLPQDCCF